MSDTDRRKKTDWVQLASFVLIILLGVEDGMLIVQNRRLKEELNDIFSPAELLKPGDRVDGFKVQTMNGDTMQISYSDSTRKSLIFVFSVGCPPCERNLANWQSIFEESKSNNVSVLGVCLDDLEKMKAWANAKKPVFFIASSAGDTSFGRKYKISGVPKTILIKGGGGIVEKVWNGELSNDQKREVETLTGG